MCKCIEGYIGDPINGCYPPPTEPPPPGDFPRPDLTVNCLADGIKVDINLRDEKFHGVMYVKGHSNEEKCRSAVDFRETGVRPLNFTVNFGSCGLFHNDVSVKFDFLRISNGFSDQVNFVSIVYTAVMGSIY